MNIKIFLKLFTAINENFINEYFKFYELAQKNKYNIDLNLVIEYLEIKNNEIFIKRFKDNYIENVDYIKKIKDNKKKELGDKIVTYHITLDTFEKICMMSKAKKANNVRDYFITLRKFIQYYKDNIANMIIKNGKLEINKYVYIILVNKGKNIFKFGKTNDIRNRLKNYQTGQDVHPDIKFIMLVKDNSFVENCVKDLIKKYEYKHNQEIYKINIDIMKDKIFKCAQLEIEDNELLQNKNLDSYIIFDDINDNDENIKLIKSKKSSKKTSKKSSKKNL